MHIQHQQQGFSLNSLKAEICISRQTLDGVAVQPTAFNFQNLPDKAVPHAGETFSSLLHAGAGIFHGLGQSDDAGHIFRTGAPALFLRAAVNQVRQENSLAAIEDADTLGPWNLWADRESRSICCCLTSMGTLVTACTASV